MTLRASIGVALDAFTLDVALEVGDGEVVALLGPNGAGKTTALRAVAGLLPIDRGRIDIGGDVVDEPATRTFVPPADRAVGYVPQDHVLFPHLSALDNVAFGRRARGATRADARATAATLLDRLGLGDHAGARPAALSGGQAQRVALARGLVIDPQVVFADEPTGSLDSLTGEHVMELLVGAARQQGTTVVLVTHDARWAAYADREVVVRDGKVTALVDDRAAT